MVITTYEGQHDHTIPSAQTVTHNTSGADTDVTPQNASGADTDVAPQNGESRSETEEKEVAGLDMVVHVSETE